MNKYVIFLMCIVFTYNCSRKVIPIAPHIDDNSAGTIEVVEDGSPYPYYLHTPDNYEEHDFSYPLLVFLHGAGELSNTLSPVSLRNGPLRPLFVEQDESIDTSQTDKLNKWVKGSFVYVPQTNEQQLWNESLEEVIEELIAKYPIDTKRIYLTGLSLGGKGVWVYAKQNSNYYAAIVPVCGPETALGKEVLSDMPIWAFYSFDDAAVPINRTITPILERILGTRSLMDDYPHKDGDSRLPAKETLTISFGNGAQALWNSGVPQKIGQINYTLYPDVGHDVWTPAYQDDTMWEWLFQQSL